MTLAERPLASTQLSRSETVEHALRREIAIKRLKKAAKEALIGALDGPSLD